MEILFFESIQHTHTHTHIRARIKYIFKKVISQFYIREKVKKIHKRAAKVIKIVQELKIIFNCGKSVRNSRIIQFFSCI